MPVDRQAERLLVAGVVEVGADGFAFFQDLGLVWARGRVLQFHDLVGDFDHVPGLVAGLGADDRLDAGGDLNVESSAVLELGDLDVDLVGLDDQRLRRLLLQTTDVVWRDRGV